MLRAVHLLHIGFILVTFGYRQIDRVGWGLSSSGLRLQKLQAVINSCTVPTPHLDKTVQLFNNIFLKSRGHVSKEPRIYLSDSTFIQFEAIAPSTKRTDETMSFAGIGISSSAPEEITRFIAESGGAELLPMSDYHYGACMVPDEDDMKTTPVRYGTMVDANGYMVETFDGTQGLEGGHIPGGVSNTAGKIILYVEDLDESIAFYTALLGMTLYRKRSNVMSQPREASMVAHVGFGAEGSGICLELKYRYGTDKIAHVPYPCTLALSVDDLHAVASLLKSKGHSGEMAEDGAVRILDPSGYKVEIRGDIPPGISS